MIDLKETRRIKNLLLEQPQRFESIIEDTYLAICITDNRGYFVAVNQNYCQLYHYVKTDLIGNHFAMVVPAENRESLKRYHDQFFKDKYEIIRQWKVVDQQGKEIFIFADAGYNDKINGKPHKVTLVQSMGLNEKADESKLANNIVK